MSDVILSSAVRSNLLSLQNTASLLETTQSRLATGLRVNSALDDPAAFFTASSLNSRGSDLNRLLDSVGLAIQTVEAADTGISAITDLVEAAQASARNALQAPGPTASAATTTGNVDLNTANIAATVTGTGISLSADAAAVRTGTVDISGETDFIANTGISQGDTLTVNGTVITFGNGGGAEVQTTAQLLSAVEAATGIGAGNAVLDGSNQLQITSADADTNITTLASVAAVNTALGLTDTTTNATNLLSQGFVQGETLTVNVGGAGVQTVTFGTGVGEATTQAELNALLGALTGVTASQTNGNLTLTASNTTDSIVVGGNTGTQLGLASDTPTIAPTPTDLLTGGLGIAQNDTLTIDVGGTVTTITFGTGTSEVNTTAELDAAIDAITGVSGSIDGTSGFLTIAATDNTTSFTLGGTDVTSVGLAAGANAPVAGTVNNATRTAAETEFNNLLTQIDQLAGDSSFNGNNLLDGDSLTVIFNEDGSSSLAIAGVTFNAAGLGISTAATDAFQTDSNINTTLTELDTAISTLRTQAATFGSNLSVVQIRQDFTKNLINTLETGAAGLTLADTNEEAANVTALQTRQSFSTSTLSLAARADQGALQLLR